jgi:hypothetical protein
MSFNLSVLTQTKVIPYEDAFESDGFQLTFSR